MSFFKKDFNKTLHEAQKDMLPVAKSIAKDNGFNLDYSHESIEVLDALIAKIAKDFKEHGLTKKEKLEDNEGVLGISEALGCYIVECIERNQGKGKWVDIDGQASPGFDGGDGTEVFPINWVFKKMANPKEYSVLEQYRYWIINREYQK